MVPATPPPPATYDVIAAEVRHIQAAFATLAAPTADVLIRIDAAVAAGSPPPQTFYRRWLDIEKRVRADHARYLDLLTQGRVMTEKIVAWAERSTTDREHDLALKLAEALDAATAIGKVAQDLTRERDDLRAAIASLRDEYEPDENPARPAWFSNLRHTWRVLIHGL